MAITKITFTHVLYSCVTLRQNRMALWSVSRITPLTGLHKSSVCFSQQATIFRRHITVSAENMLKIQVCIKSEKNNRYFMWGHAYYIYIYIYIYIYGGRQWRIWLRHCATSRKVAGSIPNGVTGIFIDIILPAVLWPWGWLSLQQKWVPGIFPGGKGGQCIGLTPLPLSSADCLEIW